MMVQLSVLDVFCTVFECATTSRSKFKILSIFAIFRFLIYGFWPFDHQNVDDFSFVGIKIFFSKSIIINLFQKKNVSRLILFSTLIFVIFSIFHISTYGRIFNCEYIVEYSTVPEISHRKVWNLSFLTHSNAFIALLVAEISSFQLQKVPQLPPLQSVSYKVLGYGH